MIDSAMPHIYPVSLVDRGGQFLLLAYRRTHQDDIIGAPWWIEEYPHIHPYEQTDQRDHQAYSSGDNNDTAMMLVVYSLERRRLARGHFDGHYRTETESWSVGLKYRTDNSLKGSGKSHQPTIMMPTAWIVAR